jgi:hypothetical protein
VFMHKGDAELLDGDGAENGLDLLHGGLLLPW